MSLLGKDILELRTMSAEDIGIILRTAESMEEIIKRTIKKVPTLRGRTVVNLFYEPSTRTRTSFELAAKYMSADSVNFGASTSSVRKGETLLDTVRTIESMGIEVVVIRHPVSGSAHFLAERVSASVINAGDGIHEHPTQGLLDLYTIRKHKGEIAGLKVAIVGDIYHSRVARSDIWGLKTMGAEVRVSAPPTMLPPGIEEWGVRVGDTVEDALSGADVVIALRLQLERQGKALFPSPREYSRLWGINRQRLGLCAPGAILMHPGPMNRGLEITSDAADGPASVINEQVTHGVAVRMAILYLLLGGRPGTVVN